MAVGPDQSTGQFLGRTLIPALVVLIEAAIHQRGEFSARHAIAALLGGWLLSLILCAIAQRFSWRASGRFFVLWFLLFIVRGVNLALEWYFFSTEGLPGALRLAGSTALTSLALAALVAWLFPPAHPEGSVGSSVRWLLSQRPWFSWIWRVAAGVVTYVFAYFFFGVIAFQFTKPYYTDPAYGLNLTLPAIGVVIKLQFLRGFTFVLASILVLAGLKVSKPKQAWLMGMALFILGGLSPLVAAEEWPVALRFYHTVEIFFQNFVAGAVLAMLLGVIAPQLTQSLAAQPEV